MATRTVAFLSPLFFDEECYIGGGERYPTNLAKGIAFASGGEYRVEIISFSTTSRLVKLARGVDLRLIKRARRPSNPLDVVSWEILDAFAGADLVHIQQAYTRCSEVGILAARQLGRPICVTDHGGTSSTLGSEIDHLELVDRIVAQSQFAADQFETRRPISLVPGGVDAELFRPPIRRPKRDRFLFVGRILPHKGVDVLLKALPKGLPLTICGRPYSEDYYRKVIKLCAGKDVQIITDADDETIQSLYARAWATVLPSVYRDCYDTVYRAPELMGFTLLEAMACGTPAICSRVGGMPEFVREGNTGFVFDSPEELADQLLSLANNPELVETLGRQAREVVEQEYDLAVAGRRLVAIYDDLLKTRSSEAAA
ncbi:MAG TPA: glycosyltransferase family 4 protein [Isosphaeraceae bacterium]|nr:glycosyltransferase family 4 protein [Isosphaeraceae bacterium]